MAAILSDADIFDPSRRRFVRRQDVLVEDGRIRRVGPAGSFRIPADAEPIAHRRYIVPGLVDFHTHAITRDAFRFLRGFGPPMKADDPALFLRYFVGYGVTTIRDIGNYRGVLSLRDGAAKGRLVGPRILAAGELLEGPTALWPLSRTFRTDAQVRVEVRRQKRMGVDWLKIYANVPPALARAVVREGHRQRLPVAGHIGATTARQAAGFGIDSLEHATTLVDDGFLPERWRRKLPTGNELADRRQRMLLRWLHADFHGPAAQQLVARLKRNRVVVSPTMVVHENIYAGPHRDVVGAIEGMPARWRRTWEGRRKGFPVGSEWEDVWRRVQRLLRLLRREGVTIIPSTDAAGWNPFAAPGITLHRELGIFESLGFSRGEVLALATAGAAKALDRDRELGAIGAGRSADFLVLRRNPLDDLRHLREPEAVSVRGVVHAAGDLRP